ncbi:Protein NEP-22, partial [Aphelenchoides avenae]
MVHVDKISAVLILITLGVAIGSLVLNIIILTKQKDSTPPPPPETCSPPPAPTGKISNTSGFKVCFDRTVFEPLSCIQEAADQLLRGLDFSVDPCDDFYQFTCAKYLKNTPIPKGRSRIGTYDEAQEVVNDAIVSGIEADRMNKISATETILRNVYDSCLNDTKGPRPDRSKAVYDKFVAAWGGVPALNTTTWKALTADEFWEKVGNDEGSFALPTLVQSFVSADWGQATQHALYLNQGPLANPRDFYVQPPFLSQITQYLQDVKDLFRNFANDIKSGVKPETLDAAATKVVQLEIELALAMVPDDLQRNYQQQ